MTPKELSDARDLFGLGRRDFAQLLGYTGEPRNNWLTIKRYETGERIIPPMVARLVRLLIWFKNDTGYLPDLDAGERYPMALPAISEDEPQ